MCKPFVAQWQCTKGGLLNFAGRHLPCIAGCTCERTLLLHSAHPGTWRQRRRSIEATDGDGSERIVIEDALKTATAQMSPQKRPARKPNSFSTPSPLTRSVGSTVELRGLVKKNGVGARWNSLICGAAPEFSSSLRRPRQLLGSAVPHVNRHRRHLGPLIFHVMFADACRCRRCRFCGVSHELCGFRVSLMQVSLNG